MLINTEKSKIKKHKHFAHQFVQLIVLRNQLVYYYPSESISSTTFVVPISLKICEMHAYCAVHFSLIAFAVYDHVVW